MLLQTVTCREPERGQAALPDLRDFPNELFLSSLKAFQLWNTLELSKLRVRKVGSPPLLENEDLGLKNLKPIYEMGNYQR
jgi:hypothetical protein